MTPHEFLDHTVASTRRLFDEVNEIHPMYHIITGTGEEVIVPRLPGDKDRAVMAIRLLMKAARATRYAMIDEAWMLDTKDEALARRAQSGEVSVKNIPGRKEVVIICIEDESAGEILAHMEIIRPEGEKPYLGPVIVQPEGGVSEGRMVGLLPGKGTPQ
jgi:hypothetical protein